MKQRGWAHPLSLWRWLAAKSSFRILHGSEQSEDIQDLSNSKNMVFDMKNLLNVGVDLALWRRGEKMRPGRNKQQILRI
jgi:hypothetical protein